MALDADFKGMLERSHELHGSMLEL